MGSGEKYHQPDARAKLDAALRTIMGHTNRTKSERAALCEAVLEVVEELCGDAMWEGYNYTRICEKPWILRRARRLVRGKDGDDAR
jgi:hypothetical protein